MPHSGPGWSTLQRSVISCARTRRPKVARRANLSLRSHSLWEAVGPTSAPSAQPGKRLEETSPGAKKNREERFSLQSHGRRGACRAAPVCVGPGQGHQEGPAAGSSLYEYSLQAILLHPCSHLACPELWVTFRPCLSPVPCAQQPLSSPALAGFPDLQSLWVMTSTLRDVGWKWLIGAIVWGSSSLVRPS